MENDIRKRQGYPNDAMPERVIHVVNLVVRRPVRYSIRSLQFTESSIEY